MIPSPLLTHPAYPHSPTQNILASPITISTSCLAYTHAPCPFPSLSPCHSLTPDDAVLPVKLEPLMLILLLV